MSINEYIAKQFANPHGFGGRIVMAVMKRQNAEMYEATEALLHPRSQDIILDIGCGDGTMMARLTRVCDCRLIGADISEDVLESAKRRLAGAQAEFLCCPVDAMPLGNATVDKALTINTIYFWDELAKGFEEISRVLKQDGIFIATHYTRRSLATYPHTQFGYKMYSEEDIAFSARSAGFKVAIQPIMEARAYCLVCRK